MNQTDTPSPSPKTEACLHYLDNAATSWPKPPEVAQAMRHFIDEIGANPGRSGHRLSVDAARVMYDTREAVAELFGADDPMRVIFGANITDGLNLALHGFLRPGDHVITSRIEHNAVMRPLRALERQGVAVTTLPCDEDGRLEPSGIEAAIQGNTRLIVLTHASNVCGTILPVREAGLVARRRGIRFLVDTAQTAGVLPIHMEQDGIDLLAFTGHKSLYGPTGTGGLVLGSRVDPLEIRTLKQGGTGSRSEMEEQPEFLPDRFESGTPNAVGLAGLLAGLRWLRRQGSDAVRAHEQALCVRLLAGLLDIPGVTVYGPLDPARQTATVAFNIRGMESSTVGFRLDEEDNVLCRVGLHCAPAAHHTLGTFPHGCVRFGLGAFNTSEDVDRAVAGVKRLAGEVQ